MRAAVEYETSRDCPECGTTLDMRKVKGGGKTSCRSALHPGRRVSVMRRMVQPAAVADTAAVGEADPGGGRDWRDMLGAELDAPRCDDECGCGGPPMRWTLDHTGILCPVCGPGCWDVAPATAERGRAHVKAATALVRVASSPAAQADVDQRARQVGRYRARLVAAIDQWLNLDGLDPDSASDLRWYRQEASDPAAGLSRIAQLTEQMNAETFRRVDPPPQPRRHWWQTDPDTADLDDEGPELDDDEPARPALTDEQRAAVARYTLRAIPGGAAVFRPVTGITYGPGGVILDNPYAPDNGDRQPGWITRRARLGGRL